MDGEMDFGRELVDEKMGLCMVENWVDEKMDYGRELGGWMERWIMTDYTRSQPHRDRMYSCLQKY